ncbi:hypothetical protein WOSG25_090190 [Weissella oryzae SG25]|uniref:Uncharacterized protein n=1 Tax=Weissella oryzae (strain DSM 25784 / JCM 18191 / LMG 30913 / SG25) TaxID=1329250 RepID=A0A069CVD1_WEIOS|nr:hypothetical protein [Weissella oryzae]GAK31322.1 hypothetical protein WOSG25_090190 [Weissella oryzae SG25]
MYELKLNDLREIGREKNATAKLTTGQIGELRKDGLYITHSHAYIDGQFGEVKLRRNYKDAYPLIKTIKRGRALIAERRNGKLVTTYKYNQSR